MKIIGIFFLFIMYIINEQNTIAQSFDCMSTLKLRYASPPYKFNELSKSAVCRTGEKYEYLMKLEKNSDYRISFFASTVFNNNINFKILNNGSGEILIDMPGLTDDTKKLNALEVYFDSETNKLIHPFFDLSPKLDTEIKILVDIIPENLEAYTEPNGILVQNNQKKGCVTIFIQSKPTEIDGF